VLLSRTRSPNLHGKVLRIYSGPTGAGFNILDGTLEFVSKAELDRALEEVQRLREKHERQQRENQRLEQELEEARRALKRQAAPFSRRNTRVHFHHLWSAASPCSTP
jgi:hypothetical protein